MNERYCCIKKSVYLCASQMRDVSVRVFGEGGKKKIEKKAKKLLQNKKSINFALPNQRIWNKHWRLLGLKKE